LLTAFRRSAKKRLVGLEAVLHGSSFFSQVSSTKFLPRWRYSTDCQVNSYANHSSLARSRPCGILNTIDTISIRVEYIYSILFAHYILLWVARHLRSLLPKLLHCTLMHCIVSCQRIPLSIPNSNERSGSPAYT
jgi:hypothetical protein